MNRIIRAFAAFIVSICLILAPALAYATTSVGGWTAVDSFIAGANTTINATKTAATGAMRSAVSVAPVASKVGKVLIRGGGAAALLLAVPQLIGDGVDWVLDPANNSIKYAEFDQDLSGSPYIWYNDYVRGITADAACSSWIGSNGYVHHSTVNVDATTANCMAVKAGVVVNNMTVTRYSNPDYGSQVTKNKSISIDAVAAKVISNASAGHAPSQEAVKTAALDGFALGEYDSELDAVAVPDTSVVNPPVTDPTNPYVPFDPSSIIAAIKSVMSAVTNMSGILSAKIDALMIDLGLKHDQKIAADAANTAQIVAANDRTGAQVSALATAIADIEGNMLTGEVINDAIDRAIAAGATDTASIVTAIEAIEGNTLDGQVINDAIDRVIANDNVNAQSAADAATAAADAAKAADVANTTAVTDAVDAQTDAITEADPITGEMSLKFPKFCSWALPVCTFTDWAMADPQLEEPEDTRPEIQDLTKYDTVDISQNYITASGQCPPAADLSLNFGVVKLSYEPLCIILDKLSGVIVAVAYISVGFMIIRTV